MLLCVFTSYAFALSPLKSFSFTAKDKFEVPGTKNKECDGVDSFSPSAPGIALALENSMCKCCSNGKYNNQDYVLETGLVGKNVVTHIVMTSGRNLLIPALITQS